MTPENLGYAVIGIAIGVMGTILTVMVGGWIFAFRDAVKKEGQN